MEKCAICTHLIAPQSPIFTFPKFGPTHALAKYAGAVHVQCIRGLPDSIKIADELRAAYLSIFNEKSETPIVAQDGNLLIMNCFATGGNFDVCDFDDFVEFYVPLKALPNLRSLPVGADMSLGVQKLQRLFHRDGGAMELEIKRPFFVVDFPHVSFARLIACLDAAERASVRV